MDNTRLHSLQIIVRGQVRGITPAFDPLRYVYECVVGSATTSVTLDAITDDAQASIDLGGLREVQLDKPVTLIEVAVTSQDGITSKSYIVSVRRQMETCVDLSTLSVTSVLEDGAESGALKTLNLNVLKLTDSKLGQARVTYSVDCGFFTRAVVIACATADDQASVQVESAAVNNQTAVSTDLPNSRMIPLGPPGTTSEIRIVVTAAAGNSKKTVVRVVRAGYGLRVQTVQPNAHACPLSLALIENPVLLQSDSGDGGCQQPFSHMAAAYLTKTCKVCPLSRETFTRGLHLVNDLKTSTELMNERVYCPNRRFGCGKAMIFANLAGHLARHCKMVPLSDPTTGLALGIGCSDSGSGSSYFIEPKPCSVCGHSVREWEGEIHRITQCPAAFAAGPALPSFSFPPPHVSAAGVMNAEVTANADSVNDQNIRRGRTIGGWYAEPIRAADRTASWEDQLADLKFQSGSGAALTKADNLESQ